MNRISTQNIETKLKDILKHLNIHRLHSKISEKVKANNKEYKDISDVLRDKIDNNYSVLRQTTNEISQQKEHVQKELRSLKYEGIEYSKEYHAISQQIDSFKDSMLTSETQDQKEIEEIVQESMYQKEQVAHNIVDLTTRIKHKVSSLDRITPLYQNMKHHLYVCR